MALLAYRMLDSKVTEWGWEAKNDIQRVLLVYTLLKPEKLLRGGSWSVWVLLGAQVEHEPFFCTLSLFSPQLLFLSRELWGPQFEWFKEKNKASIITLLCFSTQMPSSGSPRLWLRVQPGVFKWQDLTWTVVKVSHPPPQCHAYYPCKLRQQSKLSLKYS